MFRLCIKQCGFGLVYSLICTVSATVILSLFNLLAYLFLPFNVIVIYILGAVLSVAASFIFKKMFFGRAKYFLQGEINDNKKNNLWIGCIKQKKFFKKKSVVLSYISPFIIGLLFLIPIIVLYKFLAGNVSDMLSYFWHTAVCVSLISMAVSLIMYGIFGIKSLSICKKCDAVNAFIYDEEVDFTSSSAFTGASYNAPIVHHGISWGGGGYNARKSESFSNQISCHCACCGEKTTLTETPDDSKVISKS